MEKLFMNVYINSNLTNCFQSVSNGKSLVAAAITDKGISTAATATYAQMAGNIQAIKTQSVTVLWVTFSPAQNDSIVCS